MKGQSVLLFLLSLFISSNVFSEVIEISGSAFATEGAPIPNHVKTNGEKLILVDPQEHAWGAYSASGKLIRWGIATTGADFCRDVGENCRTKSGSFRIYSLGGKNCSSSKFPLGTGGAPMPYCMYFNGSQAIHGSYEVEYANASHGCVRVHVADAEWLRFKFVDGPNLANHFQGTKILIKNY